MPNEHLYRLLVQGIQDYAIFLLTPDGRVASWNDGARRMKQYEPDEIIGKPLSTFYPEERRQRAAAFLEEARQRGTAEDQGWRMRRDGTRFWADAVLTAVRDASGRLLGFAKVTRDLTERREAEAALQRERDNFLAVFRTNPAGMCILRLHDGAFLDANDAYARLFGYDRGELIGRTSIEIGMAVDPERRSQMYDDIRAGREVRDVEMAVRRKDGTTAQALLSATPVEFAREACMLVMAYDMTPMISAETMRTKAAAQASEIERLSEVNRFKTIFANMAAHEMLTPLTPIRTMMRVVLQHPAVLADPTLQRHLSLLSRNVDRLMLLVQDLLDVSRLEAGRFTIHPRDLDLAVLLRDVVESFRSDADATNISLRHTGPSTLQWRGDPDRLSQVFYNLLSNAVKFTPAGGAIEVEVKSSERGVEVLVRDTGFGLHSSAVARLFRPFSRIPIDGGEQRPGSGLGLFVCKGIVELHGGHISAESDGPGKGSTFVVMLPATAGAPSAR